MSRLQPHKTYPPMPEDADELRLEAYEAIQESEDCNHPEHAIAAALRGLTLSNLAAQLSAPRATHTPPQERTATT
jgi:hypothetical protein